MSLAAHCTTTTAAVAVASSPRVASKVKEFFSPVLRIFNKDSAAKADASCATAPPPPPQPAPPAIPPIELPPPVGGAADSEESELQRTWRVFHTRFSAAHHEMPLASSDAARQQAPRSLSPRALRPPSAVSSSSLRRSARLARNGGGSLRLPPQLRGSFDEDLDSLDGGAPRRTGTPARPPPRSTPQLVDDDGDVPPAPPPAPLSPDQLAASLLAQPQQQRRAVMMLLKEAMRHAWHVTRNHRLFVMARRCAVPPPAAPFATGGEGFAQPAPFFFDEDEEMIRFEFECEWKALLEDVDTFLKSAADGGETLVSAVQYAMNIIHVMELFQRFSREQAAVSLARRSAEAAAAAAATAAAAAEATRLRDSCRTFASSINDESVAAAANATTGRRASLFFGGASDSSFNHGLSPTSSRFAATAEDGETASAAVGAASTAASNDSVIVVPPSAPIVPVFADPCSGLVSPPPYVNAADDAAVGDDVMAISSTGLQSPPPGPAAAPPRHVPLSWYEAQHPDVRAAVMGQRRLAKMAVAARAVEF